jgi:hypothetical protein
MGAVLDREGFAGHLLVVEDDPGLRFLLERVLEGAGYEVASASDPEEAIQMVEQAGGHLALLVSDLSMPRMSGSTLAGRLAQMVPGLRTLLISGYPESTFREEAGGLDHVSFLQKPFTPSKLRETVAAVLSAA